MSGDVNKVLIILGMHRSGTSLMAQWLSACGINLGDNLLGAGLGNTKGHFEDLDFLYLHEEILRKNNLDYLVGNDPIEISENLKLKAKYLIKYKNELNIEWGWKEPRTCLFVNHIYSQIISNPYYLILLRSYSEVIDSIYRRKIKIVKNNILFPRGYREVLRLINKREILIEKYLKSWIRYNTELLALLNSNPKKYILVTLHDLIHRDDDIINIIGDEWGFSVKPKRISYIYNKELLEENITSVIKNSSLIKEADLIQKKLHEFSLFAQNI